MQHSGLNERLMISILSQEQSLQEFFPNDFTMIIGFPFHT
jgi:hypothetical protein